MQVCCNGRQDPRLVELGARRSLQQLLYVCTCLGSRWQARKPARAGIGVELREFEEKMIFDKRKLDAARVN